MSDDEDWSDDESTSSSSIDYPPTPETSESSDYDWPTDRPNQPTTRPTLWDVGTAGPAAAAPAAPAAWQPRPPRPAPVVACACCADECNGVMDTTPGVDRLGRLHELNEESVIASGQTVGTGRQFRLSDRAGVRGPCGHIEHAVCVRCVRSALAARPAAFDPRNLACLAMGAGCAATYGAGVQWCLTPSEHAAAIGAVRTVELACPCGGRVTADVFALEQRPPPGNVERCRGRVGRCPNHVCFDCGAAEPAYDDGVCSRCAAGAPARLRSSAAFPGVAVGRVNREMVAGRAREIVAHAGLAVGCDECGATMCRAEGCSTLTHCAREVCVDCGTRGCSSTGVIHDRCCEGVAEAKAAARPAARVVLALTTLWRSSPAEVARDVLAEMLADQLARIRALGR
jgi:hypothetical protein